MTVPSGRCDSCGEATNIRLLKTSVFGWVAEAGALAQSRKVCSECKTLERAHEKFPVASRRLADAWDSGVHSLVDSAVPADLLEDCRLARVERAIVGAANGK